MASRWAWVGACARAGAALTNAASANKAGSLAARLNVMVISLNPFVVAGSRRFNRTKFLKSLAVATLAGGIIFAFEFHGKKIVAMD
jgi:hypothetical protein